MKYFSIIFITLWIFLPSCTKVFFEEPQPAGKKNLSSIPGKVQGLYLSNSGDSVLRIHKNNITSYLDSGRQLKFKINNDFLIRKLDGDFYINVKDRDNSYWMVLLFTYKKGKLFVKYPVQNSEIVDKYHAITEIEIKTNNILKTNEYILNPCRKELKELLKTDFFESRDTLIKAR